MLRDINEGESVKIFDFKKKFQDRGRLIFYAHKF